MRGHAGLQGMGAQEEGLHSPGVLCCDAACSCHHRHSSTLMLSTHEPLRKPTRRLCAHDLRRCWAQELLLSVAEEIGYAPDEKGRLCVLGGDVVYVDRLVR